MTIRPLSALEFGPGSTHPLDVCVVTSEFLGPVKNGGIGTATSGLVKQLVSDGHKVTLLYTLVEYGKPMSAERTWEYWVKELAKEGVEVAHIPHQGGYAFWRSKSWHVKEFIQRSQFDVVYFNDHHGNGYYSMLAKRAGIPPFSGQLHCIITHGSIEWVCDVNDQFLRNPSDLEMIGLERRSVELSDVVIGPSHYLLKQYEKYGWKLPEHRFYQPYALFRSGLRQRNSRSTINELVFFGRLETRKGLWLFIEALDRLGDKLAGKTVTFLGRETDTAGIPAGIQILNRAANWQCEVKLLTDYDQQDALNYLGGSGRLAIMPSLADNSPCVVYECMEAGIPFITTSGSGADELLDPSCWPDVMTEPTVDGLTETLRRSLEDGGKYGKPRFDPKNNLSVWSAWHHHIAEDRTPFMVPSIAPASNRGARKVSAGTHLLVVIDNGSCDVSLLLSSFAAHLRKFGTRVAYLLLTTRRDAFLEELYAVMTATVGNMAVPICVANPFALQDAMDIILAASHVTFVDADTEVESSFFLSAQEMLDQQLGLVSCVTATRHRKGDPHEITYLPAGDLPALSALGEPMISSTWSVAIEGLAGEISALPLYDDRLDTFASSLALGQRLAQRCRAAGYPIQLLPVVGAIKTSPSLADQNQVHPYVAAKRTAEDMNIAPTVCNGGPAWFAMSLFGASLTVKADDQSEWMDFLPPDHPIAVAAKEGGGLGVSRLASALGRTELALQVEAGLDNAQSLIRDLAEVSAASQRLRMPFDLQRILMNAVPDTPNLLMMMPQIPSDGPAADAAAHALAASVSVYIDPQRVRVMNDTIHVLATEDRKTGGKIFLFDVLSLGNEKCTVSIQVIAPRTGASVQLRVMDQRTGALIGSESKRGMAREILELAVPLHRIYGKVCVAIEIEAEAQAVLEIKSLFIN